MTRTERHQQEESDFKEKEEKEERQRYIALAEDVVFPTDSSLISLPLKYSPIRRMQLHCLSALLSSQNQNQNINNFKEKLAPIFVNGIADPDIRVRALAAK